MPTHDADLLTWALRWARANDEDDPTGVRYVQCRLSVAEKIIDPNMPDQGHAEDQLVDLIMMDGDFLGRMAHPPMGARLPAGPHLHLLIDHRTHRRIGWGLGSDPYDIADSGLPVITLKP
jgi:hypothetical protein